MAKAKKLSLLERGRIVELHKQSFSQHAIAAEPLPPPPPPGEDADKKGAEGAQKTVHSQDPPQRASRTPPSPSSPPSPASFIRPERSCQTNTSTMNRLLVLLSALIGVGGLKVSIPNPKSFMTVIFLTAGTKSGIVLQGVISKFDYEIVAAEKGTLKSGDYSLATPIDINACRTKEGKIILNEEEVSLTGCKKSVCEVTELKEKVGCTNNRICVRGACKETSICTFTGPSVIDIAGNTNKIKDRCNYLLLGSTVVTGFTVRGVYMDRRRKDTSFLDKVEIIINSVKYELEQGGKFKKKGTEETLTATAKDIDALKVSKTVRGVLVIYAASGYTIAIFFDGYTLQITITGSKVSSFGATGMCGKASLQSSTVKDSCDTKYTESPDPSISCTKVTESCGILNKAPFTECNAVVKPDPYVKVCKDTLCAYPSRDNLKCQFLETYARACEVMTTKKVDGWRSSSNCPATPKALCQGIYCSSKEFCGQKDYSTSWTCLCRPVKVLSYTKDNTLGDSTYCDKNKASVSLVNCLLKEKGIDYTKLQLNDPTCKGELDNSNGMVTFGFDGTKKCGATITDSDTEVVYQNTITNQASTGEVSRDKVVKITFECKQVQPKVTDVELNVEASSVTKTVTSGSWTYTLTMQTFSDSALSLKASSLKINQRVWVGLTSTGLDANLAVIAIDSCWATKTKNAEQKPKYFLIENGCPSKKDTTVQIKGSGTGTSCSFSFNAFQFSDGTKNVFVHCKVKLCSVKTGKTCTPTCPGNGRKRRFASFMDEDTNPALITMAWTS
ncbi:alpha-tectorin-like [Halichoeres trimaculatus]|uniref:alpha-tectorin-like n=1 Tax=Halichoeres trimaculatus TaxID=147232 RepID=UPI003D9F4017